MAAVLAVALLAGLVTGIRWWTQPEALRLTGGGFRAAPVPLERSALHVAVSSPRTGGGTETVSLRAASAQVSHDSAESRISFTICRPRSRGDVIGAVRGDLDRWCRATEPLGETDVAMTVGPRPTGDYLVVTVAPTRPGRTRITSVEVNYARGWRGLLQRGSDRVALDLTVRAR